MRNAIKLLLVFVTLLTTLPLLGEGAKKGWIKLELTRTDGGAIPDALISAAGAELVTRFDNRAIVQAPKGRVASIIQGAASAGVSVRERNELDLLQLPGAVVDVREGIVDAPHDKLVRAYRPGTSGLFLLQFTAAPHPQWIADVESLGWKLVRYVPHNAFIAVGAPELAARTRALPFLQWVDFYHPYQKHSLLARDGVARSVMFELPAGPAAEETIEAIRASASGAIRIHRGAVDTIVHATMNHGQAERLLHQQLIIGVGPEPVLGLSDERQVMSLTSNVNATQTAPTNPGSYWSWVLSRCPNCSTMPAADWKVGVADTGLDNGQTSGGHPDLAGRKYFGANFSTSSTCANNGLPPLCGWNVHGTFVSGIIAAKGSSASGGTGFTDTDGYYLGQGVAPTAGIFMTRISADSAIGSEYLLGLTHDAASNGVSIQNHSFNEYGATPNTSGTYSTLARMYDLAVRDANNNPADGQAPLFISVSAGNNFSGSTLTPGRGYVIAGGTAKNVLSVSATENAPQLPVDSSCGTDEDDYQNIAWFSRTDTLMPNYIKPDVVAPGAAIVSTHPPIKDQSAENYCEKYVGGHTEYGKMNGGTSFAAPVGAGAAILVKRYLGATPGATSPALTKAMIIAGARSIRGGIDRSHFTTAPVGAAPNARQGFGRISLDDVLTGTTPPAVFDQDSDRRFTAMGQSRIARLKVRDAAKPVKVVLVWSDAAAMAGATNPLVNDLDLEVTPATGNVVYVGNRLSVSSEAQGETSTAYTIGQAAAPDGVNNVEYARFFGSANAEFNVTVRASRISGDIDGVQGFEQDFALVAVNAAVVSGFIPPLTPPANLVATASGSSVTLTWTKVTNATGYLVERKVGSGPWATAVEVSGGNAENTTDIPGTPDGVVIYRVRATAAATKSAASNFEVAYAKVFADEVLLSGPLEYSKIRAEHIVELRKAVNALRAIGGLEAAYMGDDLDPEELRSEPILATQLTTLRDRLNEARLGAGLTGIVTLNPDPVAAVKILPAQIEALRNGLK